jgi:hypothetical protein
LVPTSSKELRYLAPLYQLFIIPDDFSFSLANGMKKIYHFQDNKLTACDIIYDGSEIEDSFKFKYSDDSRLSAISDGDGSVLKFEYLEDKIVIYNEDKETTEIFLNDKIVTRLKNERIEGRERVYSFDKESNTLTETYDPPVVDAKAHYTYNENNELLSKTAYYNSENETLVTFSYKYDEYGNWIENSIIIINNFSTEYVEYLVKREIIYE